MCPCLLLELVPLNLVIAVDEPRSNTSASALTFPSTCNAVGRLVATASAALSLVALTTFQFRSNNMISADPFAAILRSVSPLTAAHRSAGGCIAAGPRRRQPESSILRGGVNPLAGAWRHWAKVRGPAAIPSMRPSPGSVIPVKPRARWRLHRIAGFLRCSGCLDW